MSKSIQLVATTTILLACVTCNAAYPSHNTPPVFDFKREWIIPENEAVGTRVITVRTRDQERDSITYGIEPSLFFDGSKFFTINARTGDVFLKESLVGQGGKDLYILVTAFDGHQTAKIETFIRVTPATTDQSVNGTLLPTSEVRGLFDRGNRPSPVGSTRSKKFKHRTFVLPPDRNAGSAAWPVVPPMPSLDPAGDAGPTPDFLPTARPMPPVRIPSLEETEDVGRENRVDAQRDTATDRQQHSSNWLLMLLPIPIAVVLSLFCGSVIFLAFQRYKRNERRSIIKSASQKLPLEFENSSRETSISSVSTDCNPVDVVRGKRSFKNRYQTSDDDFPPASLFTPNDGWEFPRQNLRFTNCMLGEGNFGLVWRCEALDFYQSGQSQAVAVKTLKRSHSSKELRDLLSEIEIMKMLDPHPYVVRLLGCCSDAEPVYLIMEYVPYGKLQDFLRKSRKDVENGVSAVTSEQLTSFAYQIAAGMEYISSKKIIHRDLAARNILLGENSTCKIADFGFARDVNSCENNVYERKSEGPLPIRWMAPESLVNHEYSVMSDVWSFGVLMWEIVTLGCTPYASMSPRDISKHLLAGKRLERPDHCKQQLYAIMCYCWEPEPKDRVSFHEVKVELQTLIETRGDYIQLDHFPDRNYYNVIVPTSGERL